MLALLLPTACTDLASDPADEELELDDGKADSDRTGTGDVVARWARVAADAVRSTSTVPPHAARIYGYVGLAMHEAAQAGITSPRSLAPALDGVATMPRPERARHDRPLTVATAAAAVLSELLPAAAEKIAAALEQERAESSASAAAQRRADSFGKAVAANLIRRIGGDGFTATRGRSFALPIGPDKWVPTGAQAAPLEPYWGSIATFIGADAMEACAEQAGPPVEFSTEVGSAMYQQAFDTWEAVVAPKPGEELIAYYWADAPGQTTTPPGHWIEIAADVIDDERLSLTRAARTLALVGMAASDAFVTGWKLKYEYNLLRPVTYIQRHIDPSWKPVLATPPFPEYVSGHSVGSGAAAAVLTQVFGPRHAFVDRSRDGVTVVDSGNDPHQLETRSFASFDDAAREAASSRLYGGIHFPMGNEGGLVAGRCVAEALLERDAK